MGAVEVLLSARADAAGRAQRRATVRHTHLSDSPFALVCFQMANEAFSALAVAYGTSPSDMMLQVVAEPRNRVLSIRALTEVARSFCPWFRGFSTSVERIPRRHGAFFERSLDAPQLLVPNRATVEVLGRWGRRLAYLPTTGEFAVDPVLVEMGQHLQFISEHARVPGQSLVVPATSLLTRHWAAAQSRMENENLAALDAWIDPPNGAHGFAAAEEAEDQSLGPLLQPDHENRIFELIAQLNEKRRGSTDPTVCEWLARPLVVEMRPVCQRAWRLLWRAVNRERSFMAGARVRDRWEKDRDAYTWHAAWVRMGRRRRARDTVQKAARLRIRLEEAESRLQAQEVFDDPLALAELELDGKAVTGVVVDVDDQHTEQGPSRRVSRPLITIRSRLQCRIPPGREMWCSEDPEHLGAVVHAVRTDADGASLVTFKVTHGMRSARLPRLGASVSFASVSLRRGPRLPLPDEVPWTHQPPVDSEPVSIESPAEPGWEEQE